MFRREKTVALTAEATEAPGWPPNTGRSPVRSASRGRGLGGTVIPKENGGTGEKAERSRAEKGMKYV